MQIQVFINIFIDYSISFITNLEDLIKCLYIY